MNRHETYISGELKSMDKRRASHEEKMDFLRRTHKVRRAYIASIRRIGYTISGILMIVGILLILTSYVDLPFK